MKNYIKIMCLSLVLALSVLAFAACSETEQPVESETTSEVTSEVTSETTSEELPLEELPETSAGLPVRDPGLYDGEQAVEPGVIMTINGVDIDFDTYRYYYLTNRYYFDYGDTSIWTGETEDMDMFKDLLKEQTEISILSSFAINKIAEEQNIELDDDDTAQADAAIEELITTLGGQESFELALSSQYYTQDLYKELYLNSLLVNKVVEARYGDAIRDNFNETYVRAQHILIPFTDAAAEEHADDLALAEDIKARLDDGEDFEELRAEYNNDPGQPDEGYYFTTGEMVVEFEEAAFALEENAISDIVETSYGYHIIRRLPMQENYLDDLLMNYMTDEMITEFSTELEEISAEIEISYGENYDLIAPENVF